MKHNKRYTTTSKKSDSSAMTAIYDIVFDFLFSPYWEPSENRIQPKYYSSFSFEFSNLLSDSAEAGVGFSYRNQSYDLLCKLNVFYMKCNTGLKWDNLSSYKNWKQNKKLFNWVFKQVRFHLGIIAKSCF